MRELCHRSGPLIWLLVGLAACTGEPSGSASEAGSQPAAASPRAGEGTATGACRQDPFGCAVIPDGDPIRLGTALTLTGPQAALGLDGLYGAQVALSLRGAVLGREVLLVDHDDRCSAGGGTAAANLLAAEEGIVAVVGTTCSAAAIPAAQLLGERGILLISPSNTAPSLTDPGTHQPFYARVAHNDAGQASAMAEFACTELAVSTAATIHDGSSLATRLVDEFASEFEARCDGTVTAREVAPDAQDDLDAMLATIAASNEGSSPELLYCPVATKLGGLIMDRAHRADGMEETFLAGARTGQDGRIQPAFLANAGAAAQGMYLSGADIGLTGAFYETIFLEEYTAVSGEEAPLAAFHGHAYDAVNIVLDAVAQVAIESDGALYVPRTRLRDAVLHIDGYEGLTGELTCRRNGDCARPSIGVWQVHDDEYRSVWP